MQRFGNWKRMTDPVLELRRLRSEILGLRVEISFARFVLLHRKYAPSQPRIPAGRDGAGRWTDGTGWGDDGRVRVAQNGPTRGGPPTRTSRFGARTLEGAPGQLSEWAATRVQANAAEAAVRQVDPTWRPRYPTSLTETIEGEIAHQQSRLEAAESRLSELGNPAVRGELLHECLLENGRLIGSRYKNANDPTTRTVDRETFLDLGSRLLAGAERVVFNSSYRHPQFLRSDGTVIGIRYSSDWDITYDVLRGDGRTIEQGTKIHFRGNADE